MNKESEALETLNEFDNGLVNKETGMIMFNQVWFKNQLNIIKQYILKAQEQEKENAWCVGGRSFSKEILYLKQCIEQCNDKLIYYVSRSFGNKYIVSQKEYEKLNKENANLRNKLQEQEEALKIIFEKRVNFNHLLECDCVGQYNFMVSFAKYDTKRQLTEEEFELLRRYAKNE